MNWNMQRQYSRPVILQWLLIESWPIGVIYFLKVTQSFQQIKTFIQHFHGNGWPKECNVSFVCLSVRLIALSLSILLIYLFNVILFYFEGLSGFRLTYLLVCLRICLYASLSICMFFRLSVCLLNILLIVFRSSFFQMFVCLFCSAVIFCVCTVRTWCNSILICRFEEQPIIHLFLKNVGNRRSQESNRVDSNPKRNSIQSRSFVIRQPRPL